MNRPVECLRCHTRMAPGFLLDASQRGYDQQRWTEGAPEPSFWMGLKLKKDSVFPVATFRCPTCGYLESYAIPNSRADR
jgi:hypothetical protein